MERQNFGRAERARENLFVHPPRGGRFHETAAAGADAYSVYTGNDLAAIRRANPGDYALQGNLDPMLLSRASPAEVAERAREIIASQKPFGRHIFNLGHGILPDAKIENVEALCSAVSEGA